jgi:hypothetical protein
VQRNDTGVARDGLCSLVVAVQADGTTTERLSGMDHSLRWEEFKAALLNA